MTTDRPCKVCGNTNQNLLYQATERLLNYGDHFVYLECSNCYCLQIVEVPNDLDKYYPSGYYSFQKVKFPFKLNPLISFLKKSLLNYYLRRSSVSGFLLSFFLKHPFPWMKSEIIDVRHRVLDIGCGAGRVILSMRRSGFKDLTGIDPYIHEDNETIPGVRILKKELSDVNDSFDFIMMHHSFEHMDHPLEVLCKISELMNEKSHLMIRIPVANSYAWRKYRTHWFALDAPRHLFLHTTHSMQLLAEKASLKIDSIDYDSSFVQFASSEKYLRNLPFSDDFSMFSKKQLMNFAEEAKILNGIGDGDCACFYFSKKITE